MIVVPCLPCGLVVRVMPQRVSDTESVMEVDQLVGTTSEFWPDQFPCPICSKRCTGLLENQADAQALQVLELHDLTPQEAFAAFNGLGFPAEQQCDLEAVQSLLREQPVRSVIGKTVAGAKRVLVDALELWDGSRVYFGASSDGAVVYRVSRPSSYARRVLAEVT
jgi:hypothetical protein